MSAGGAVDEPIGVLVVDDHPVFREGLRMLLASAPDVRVIGDAASTADALDAARRLRPDVALLDLDLAGEDGVAALPRLRQAAPDLKVIVLTATGDAARHQEALLAGASGLVLKDKSADVIVKAIRRVHGGELWFDRGVLDAALRRAREEREPDPERAKIATLTDREREIVALVGQGMRNEQIAARLSLREKTVRNHLTNVFDKLGVSDRLELLVYANQHGLAQLPK